jgi:hypothetical protein
MAAEVDCQAHDPVGHLALVVLGLQGHCPVQCGFDLRREQPEQPKLEVRELGRADAADSAGSSSPRCSVTTQ